MKKLMCVFAVLLFVTTFSFAQKKNVKAKFIIKTNKIEAGGIFDKDQDKTSLLGEFRTDSMQGQFETTFSRSNSNNLNTLSTGTSSNDERIVAQPARTPARNSNVKRTPINRQHLRKRN